MRTIIGGIAPNQLTLGVSTSVTLNGTNLYTPGPGISSDVANAIKQVYAGFTKAEILKNVFMAVRKTQMKALIQSYGKGPTKLCIVDYIL